MACPPNWSGSYCPTPWAMSLGPVLVFGKSKYCPAVSRRVMPSPGLWACCPDNLPAVCDFGGTAVSRSVQGGKAPKHESAEATLSPLDVGSSVEEIVLERDQAIRQNKRESPRSHRR